jgi:hypothetical protein
VNRCWQFYSLAAQDTSCAGLREAVRTYVAMVECHASYGDRLIEPARA